MEPVEFCMTIPGLSRWMLFQSDSGALIQLLWLEISGCWVDVGGRVQEGRIYSGCLIISAARPISAVIASEKQNSDEERLYQQQTSPSRRLSRQASTTIHVISERRHY
jgi:hypothetical protein